MANRDPLWLVIQVDRFFKKLPVAYWISEVRAEAEAFRDAKNVKSKVTYFRSPIRVKRIPSTS
jgi:hypothetical protein